MDKILDFKELFFGNLSEYKKTMISLFESLRGISATTFWSIDESEAKGMSAILVMSITDLILDSLDEVLENFYSNDLITFEFPYLIESKEMIACLLMSPMYESDDYLNLAITLFSDIFTLLEVKLLLFDGYDMEIEAPDYILEEYSQERDRYVTKFEENRNQFLKLVQGESEIKFE